MKHLAWRNPVQRRWEDPEILGTALRRHRELKKGTYKEDEDR
jgi:hypothetical protein